MSATATHASRQPKVGHVVSPLILIGTLLALLFFTWLTVSIRAIDLGPGNLLVAMVIACIKAALVVMFFMHLYWDRAFNVIAFVGCLGFVALFILLALGDALHYQRELYPVDSVDYAPGIERAAVSTAAPQ